MKETMEVGYKTKCRLCGKINEHKKGEIKTEYWWIFAEGMRDKMKDPQLISCECTTDVVAHDVICYSKHPEA